MPPPSSDRSVTGDGFGGTDDLHQLKLGVSSDKFFDTFRILDARHLKQYLTGIGRSLPLKRRFLNTKSVDAAVDDLERLVRRLFFQSGLHLLRQRPVDELSPLMTSVQFTKSTFFLTASRTAGCLVGICDVQRDLIITIFGHI